jgi:hypothetical protein
MKFIYPIFSTGELLRSESSLKMISRSEDIEVRLGEHPEISVRFGIRML